MIVARSLLNDLAIGMSANYHLTYIPDELQRSHFSFDVGAQYSLGTIADIGLSVRNLQRFFIKDDVILDQSTEIRLGSSYRFSYQRSEEHTSELQSRENLVCRLLLEK